MNKIQPITKNNKLLMLIPLAIGILLFLLFYFFSKGKETEDTNAKESISKFEPMSEEDTSIKDKITAYDRDRKEEERKKLLLRGSDFYKNMRDKTQEEYERQAVEKMQLGVGADYEDDDPSYRNSYSEHINNNINNTDEYYRKKELDAFIEDYINRKDLSEEKASELKKTKDLYTQLGLISPEESAETTSPTEEKTAEEKTAEEKTTEEKTTEGNIFLIDETGKRQRRAKEILDIRPNLIKACVHGNQTLLSGGTVRLRLLEPIILNGRKIPKNTIFYGTAGGGGTRLRITVENIRIGSYITPVSYIIYDSDAIEGLNIPNNLKAEAKKKMEQSLTTGIRLPLSSIGTLTSEITSAINAVSQATRQVIQAHISLIKIDLKANYLLYIHEETKEQRKERENAEKEALQFYMKSLQPKKENSLEKILEQLYNQE